MNDQLNIYLETLKKLTAEYLPKLGGALVVLIVGMWLVNRFSSVLKKAMLKREFDVSLQTFLASVLKVILKVLLVLTVAGMLGIQTTSFVAILGAAGLAVGLALQGSLSNFAGGVLTLIFKPYKVGDFIESQGMRGTVREIQIFNTILLTPENRTVILPNGAVSNNTIVNFTRHGNLRVDVPLILEGESNIEEARAIVREVCATTKGVLTDPKPGVRLVQMVNDDIELLAFVYAAPPDMLTVKDSLIEGIRSRFAAAGIEFAKSKILVQQENL